MKQIQVLFFLLTLSTYQLAHSDIILDQQHTFTSSIANSADSFSQMGQTFTVGVAGTLNHIDVLMYRLGGIFDPQGDAVMRIFNTAGGLPTGLSLAEVTVPKASVPLNSATMVSFDVNSFAIAVNPGDVFAFSLSSSTGTGPYFMPTDQGQVLEYNGGAAVFKLGAQPWQLHPSVPDQDHGFQTFVNAVPEPSAISLSCLLGFIVALKRRNRH